MDQQVSRAPSIVREGARRRAPGMSWHRSVLVGAIGALALLTGCASVVTVVEDPNALPSDGLVYWMPEKHIVVKAIIRTNPAKGNGSKNQAAASSTAKAQLEDSEQSDEGEQPDAIMVDATDAFPDYNRRFVIRQNDGLPSRLLTQKLGVSVNERGLLQSVNRSTPATLTATLKGAIESLAALKTGPALKTAEVGDELKPCRRGEYKVIAEARHGEKRSLCDFWITVTRIGSNLGGSTDKLPHTLGRTEHNGIFYRQELPYHVTVTRNRSGVEEKREFVVFSPSGAPIRFLPIPSSTFADSPAVLTFQDGVLTASDETRASEVAGLLKLPADVIGAYFSAIGNLFKSGKDIAEAERQILEERNKLLVEQLKRDNCNAAIKAGLKDDALKAACGID